ncbi:MAG: site-specific integrase [Magnetococcales bacterium]|nr:site-specific integrase [Magnetococcales bacterium]
MSIFFVKQKGWRYDFTKQGARYTKAGFKTKAEAKKAEAKMREELANPIEKGVETLTDITFLDMVNRRLDHVMMYNSKRHYVDYIYFAKRWVMRWGECLTKDVTRKMIEKFIMERSKVSSITANKEIKTLRATFNFAKKRKWVLDNPLDDMDFLPVEKRIKYVPSAEDVDRVIAAADPDTQDYLWTIRETMARVSEINQLTWDDVDLNGRFIILYTRKKKGGHLTPRKIPMTGKLFEVLSRRYVKREKSKSWVFWHTYWSSKTGKKVEGPYLDRKLFMRTLCKKAGVKYFRFHAMRHAGASIMDNNNIPMGSIQRILGHESRLTTEIYLHSLGETERQAMDVYEKARQNSHTNPHTKTNERLRG